jgi:hypothetical protein
MAIGGPLLNAAYRISLENAIVGEKWSYPDIGQLRKLLINARAKTQQFDRVLNWFRRCRGEPRSCKQENQKAGELLRHSAKFHRPLLTQEMHRNEARTGEI